MAPDGRTDLRKDLLLCLAAVLVDECLDLGDLQDRGQIVLPTPDAVVLEAHAGHRHAAEPEEARITVEDAETLQLTLLCGGVSDVNGAEQPRDLPALVNGKSGERDALWDAVHEDGRAVALADLSFAQDLALGLLFFLILQAPTEFRVGLAEDGFGDR